MFRFAPYVLKGMWRHRIRTLLTVSGTSVALLVFCFVGSVQQGLRAITLGEDSGRTLVVFQENRFCPQSSRLPEDYETVVAQIEGVQDVLPIKVFTNNCRASLDAVVFQGVPCDELAKWRELALMEGSWSEFQSRDNGAVVGSAVAQRRRLKVGDRFTIGDVSVNVAAIGESPAAAENNVIYTHLDFLQRARGANDVGTVTQFEVHLREAADPERIAGAIDAAFKSGPVATSTRTKGMFQADTLADLAELIGFVYWLGYACVGLVLSLVATTTVMAVQDRIKEHAVLQTLGVRPARVFRLVVAESVMLSALGGVIGVLASYVLLAFTQMSVATEGVTIAFRPSLGLVTQGLFVAILVGVLAGVAPAIQAARAAIVPALRTV